MSCFHSRTRDACRGREVCHGAVAAASGGHTEVLVCLRRGQAQKRRVVSAHYTSTSGSKRRLSDTFATDPPAHIDTERQKLWYAGGEGFDQRCVREFKADLDSLQNGSLTDDGWDAPYDRLALIILADQLPRNIYRGTARAFASDDKALRWASELQQSGAARAMTVPARAFSIMPYMHSEKERDQQECVSLFEEFVEDVKLLGSEQATEMVSSSLDYAKAHLAVIQQWGRFPHRNEALGRANMPEEELQSKNIPRF